MNIEVFQTMQQVFARMNELKLQGINHIIPAYIGRRCTITWRA